MKINRASEIAASPIMANVTYCGVPVYIESVSSQSHTATIHSLKEPNNSRRVGIHNLIEHS